MLIGLNKEYVFFCKGLIKAIYPVEEKIFIIVPNISRLIQDFSR